MCFSLSKGARREVIKNTVFAGWESAVRIRDSWILARRLKQSRYLTSWLGVCSCAPKRSKSAVLDATMCKSMVRIESLSASSPRAILESARSLFLAYGEFLRLSGEHPGFRFDRLQQEALDLPAAYETNNGAVLVAVAEDLSVGCIAFREFREYSEPDCCEIKRLFVLPAYRGSAIGSRLAMPALELAGQKGYKSAYLDTEPLVMTAAHRTYLKVGFVEYDRRGAGPASVSFLCKSPI